jgi:signal transduction histidine kinase
MRRTWLLLAAWLLLLVPTLAAGVGALALLGREEERLARAAREAAADRAEAAAGSFELRLARIKAELMRKLLALPRTNLTEALDQWRAADPLVRNVFLWDPVNGPTFPRSGGDPSGEKSRFLLRYEALFQGRAPWGEPEPESSLSGRSRSGWVPWFWEDRVSLLGWTETAPDGRRYGLEVETVALLSRLIVDFPAPSGADEALALLDGHGRVFHQTGALSVFEAKRLATVPVGPALPHWQVAVYAKTPARPGGKAFAILSSLLVGGFVASVLLGGSVLLWQARRSWADARRKTTFVSNVSHELKTPLTTIRMYAELLQEGRVRDEAKSRRYLDVIAAESQRLGRLVNNVLDFSRLEQGRKRYASEDLDLTAEFHRILDTQAERVQEAGMRLGRRAPDGPLPCATDRDAFEQVLLNLVDNAVKYASAGGAVVVELATVGDRVRLRVLDRGPGVPRAHQKRIFEMFHRVDESLTTRQPGSGLGLAIARRVVRDLGGDLVYRPREGDGACFEVSLPRKEQT